MIHPDPLRHRPDGAYLAGLRAEAGAARAEFARLLEVSERHLGTWERDGGYPYRAQWMAECLVRRRRAEAVADAVRARGGDRRAVLFAQTLYLSGREPAEAAVTRAVSWAATLAAAMGADHG